MQRKHRLCSRLSTFLNIHFHLTIFEMINTSERYLKNESLFDIIL